MLWPVVAAAAGFVLAVAIIWVVLRKRRNLRIRFELDAGDDSGSE